MAFKLLYTNLAGPQGDFLVDPTLTFEQGQIGFLTGTSTGTPTGLPMVEVANSGISNTILGIIDDNKTTQFLAAVWNETITSGQTTLAHANVVSGTFIPNAALCYITDHTNGTITNTGAATSVNYSYIIPGKAGDDTTLASGKCTLWLQSGEYATDVYETMNQQGAGTATVYAVGAKLYVSKNGKLTPEVGLTVVGYVTKAPSAGNPFLNFYKV
jgi:hypothetical protein